MTPSPAFARMAEKGLLGLKAGRGFYLYHKGRKRKPNPQAEALLREGQSVPSAEEPLTPDELMAAARQRMVGLMVNEAAACLGEALGESAELKVRHDSLPARRPSSGMV